jgi:hypothetical protein
LEAAVARIDLSLLERIAAQRRFESRTLEIAKRLFIHGEKPKRLSIEYGVNLQRVYAIRKEVLAAAHALALPPGWEELTVSGPRELVAQFKRQFAEALARHEAESAMHAKHEQTTVR